MLNIIKKINFVKIIMCGVILFCFVFFTKTFASDKTILNYRLELGVKHNDNVLYNPDEVKDNVYDNLLNLNCLYKWSKTSMQLFDYSFKSSIFQKKDNLNTTSHYLGSRYMSGKKIFYGIEYYYQYYAPRYFKANNLGLILAKKLNKKDVLQLQYQNQDRDYFKTPTASGFANVLAMGWSKKNIAETKLVTYTFEKMKAGADDYSFSTNTLTLGYEKKLSSKIVATTTYSYRLRDYKSARKDNYNSLGLQLNYLINKNINIILNYEKSHNKSSNANKNYDLNLFSFGVVIK